MISCINCSHSQPEYPKKNLTFPLISLPCKMCFFSASKSPFRYNPLLTGSAPGSWDNAADFYKVDPEHIIVIYDDISLDVGQLRIRKKGSAGGHNGIKNIIAHLGTQEFPRIKVGVGDKPPRMDLADYVLSRFSKEDREKMEQAFKDAAEAVEVMIAEGPDAAMNQFNGHK